MSLRKKLRLEVEPTPTENCDATPNESSPRSGVLQTIVTLALGACFLPMFGILQSLFAGGKVIGKFGRSTPIGDYLANPVNWLFVPVVISITMGWERFRSRKRIEA